MRCSFCGSPTARWLYPTRDGRDWQACERCRVPIEADDREALLARATFAPVPRTVSDRYAPRLRERARALHEEFWANRAGLARPL